MGDILDNTTLPDSPAVNNAQAQIDAQNQILIDLAKEAGLLAASSSPVGGQIVDGASLAHNLAQGNIGGAILDGIGFVPVFGDAAKGAIRGTRIARAVARANRAMDAATASLASARRLQRLARTRRAAGTYWDRVRQRRQAIIDKYKDCNTKACRDARDKELRGVSRLPANGGKWVDEAGNPVPAGTGRWLPDEGSSLHNALGRHQQPVTGVPFNDGKPDFSGFPPRGYDSPPRVEIEMSGNSARDISAARQQYYADTGTRTPSSGGPGTWHHEPDGVTMSYVDKDVHTAYQLPNGSPNSGTPHAGGDSMTRDPAF